MKPLEEARRIGDDSHNRIAELAKTMQSTPAMNDFEYRSAGHYLLDYWQARIGDEDAMKRLQTYQRTAAHQTTTDSTGVLPAPIIGPVLNFVDSARPLVNALGPRNLPSQTWSRPKVTQNTSVAEQSAEKAELTSQKMIIAKVTGTAQTFGGYVNVSSQIIDFSDPSIMDIIIGDLAAQYALQTENDATDTFLAGATAATTNLATGANTAEQVAAAFWGAVGQVYAGTKGAGPRARRDAAADARDRRPAVRTGQPAGRPVDRLLGRQLRPGRSRARSPASPSTSRPDWPTTRSSCCRRRRPRCTKTGSAPSPSSSPRCSASRSPTRATSRR